MKQTAVEWLAEKLEYVNWMRNRDEIFPELADKWRKHYLEQAKEMESKEKLKHQLFIGKVTEILGFDKTVELLKECNNEI